MSTDFDWSPPPLAPEDARLLDAYASAGRSVDDLAYTDDFEDICCAVLDGPIDNSRRHYLFKRLLTLRKQGLLPLLSRRGSR